MLQTEAPSIPARRVSLATRTCRALIKLNGGAYTMTALDQKVIEKILSNEEAMKIAKDFIRKHQESSQVPSSDLPASPNML